MLVVGDVGMSMLVEITVTNTNGATQVKMDLLGATAALMFRKNVVK